MASSWITLCLLAKLLWFLRMQEEEGENHREDEEEEEEEEEGREMRHWLNWRMSALVHKHW